MYLDLCEILKLGLGEEKMVTDFTGFEKGVIGRKLYADTTLNNMKKAELIELLHIAQHNYEVLNSFYAIAIDNSKCNNCPLSKRGSEKE